MVQSRLDTLSPNYTNLNNFAYFKISSKINIIIINNTNQNYIISFIILFQAQVISDFIIYIYIYI